MSAFYEILGVSSEAEPEVIQAAYRALMRKYHPDATGGAHADAKAKRITEAYATLSDPVRRAAYDTKVRAKGDGSKSEQQNAPPKNKQRSATKTTRKYNKELLRPATGLLIFGICLGVFNIVYSPRKIENGSASFSSSDQSPLPVDAPSPSDSSPSQAGEASQRVPAPNSDLDHTVAAAVVSAHSVEANHRDGFYLVGGDDKSFQLIDLTQSHFKSGHGGIIWVVNVLKNTQIYDGVNNVDYSWARYKANCPSDLMTITHASYNHADGSVIKEEYAHQDIRVMPETLGATIMKAVCNNDYSGLTKEPQRTVAAILEHIRGSSTVQSGPIRGLPPQAELYKAVGSLDGTADASQEGRTINP